MKRRHAIVIGLLIAAGAIGEAVLGEPAAPPGGRDPCRAGGAQAAPRPAEGPAVRDLLTMWSGVVKR